MDIANLDIRVDTKEVKKAEQDLANLERQGKKTERGSGDLSGSFGRLAGSLKVVSGLAVAVGSSFVAMRIAAHIRDVTTLAAKYEMLGITMEVAGRNAGYSVKQMHNFEKGLRAQGIAAVEARNTLTRMTAANIDLAKSSQLARAAQDVAVVGAINSSEAFERLVYGIQSAQGEVLRTIGLNVNFEKSYQKLADQLGKNAKDLTEVEKTQARVNIVLEQAAKYQGIYERSMTSAAKQMGSLQRHIDDYQVAFGKAFQPAYLKIAQEKTKAYKDLKKAVSDPQFQSGLMAIASAFATIYSVGMKVVGVVGKMTKAFGEVYIVGLKAAIADTEKQIKKIEERGFFPGFRLFPKNLEELKKELKGLNEELEKVDIFPRVDAALADAFRDIDEIITLLPPKIDNVNDGVDNLGDKSGKAKSALKDIEDEINQLTMSSNEYKKTKLNEWFDEQSKIVGKLNPVLRELYKIKTEAIEKEEKLSEAVAYQNEMLAEREREKDKWAAHNARVQAEADAEIARMDKVDAVDKEMSEAKIKRAQQEAEARLSVYKQAFTELQNMNADTIKEMLDGNLRSWEDHGDAILDIFKNTFAQIAAAALQQRIILPIFADVFGGTAMGDAAQSMIGQGSGGTMPGSASTYNWIGENVPYMGWLNQPIAGPAGMNAAYASHPAYATAGTSYGGGALTWGGAAGYGAMASLGYTYLGGALGLPQNKYSGYTSGAGGMAGAAIGAKIGSGYPGIGTIIGAIVGGIASLLFGSDTPRRHQTSGIWPLETDYGLRHTTASQAAALHEPMYQTANLAKEIAEMFGGTLDHVFMEINTRMRTNARITARIFTHDFSEAFGFKADDFSEMNWETVTTTIFEQMLRQAEFESEEMAERFESVFDNIDWSSIESAIADLELVLGFDDQLAALRSGVEELRQSMDQAAKTEMTALIDTLSGQRDIAERLGLDLDELTAAQQDYVKSLVLGRDTMTEAEAQAYQLEVRFEAFEEVLKSVGLSAEEAARIAADGWRIATEEIAAATEKMLSDARASISQQRASITGNQGYLSGYYQETYGFVPDAQQTKAIWDIYLKASDEQIRQYAKDINIDPNIFQRDLKTAYDFYFPSKSTVGGRTPSISTAGRDTTADDIARERLALERELLVTQGKTAELRKLELDALFPANRELQERIWAIQDETAEMERSRRINETRLNLEYQIAQLEENSVKASQVLAEMRKLELEAMDESLRVLQQRLWGLQDEQNEMTRSTSYISEYIGALRDEYQKLEENYNNTRYALERSIDAEKALISARVQSADSIDQLINQLKGSQSAPVQSMEFFEARYQSLLTNAKGATTAEEISKAVSELTGFVPQYLEFAGAYGGDYLSVFNKTIEDLKALEDRQRDIASDQSNYLAGIESKIARTEDTILSLNQAYKEYETAKRDLDQSWYSQEISILENLLNSSKSIEELQSLVYQELSGTGTSLPSQQRAIDYVQRYEDLVSHYERFVASGETWKPTGKHGQYEGLGMTMENTLQSLAAFGALHWDLYGQYENRQYQHGGISYGPESGYFAKLHGKEAVIPLKGGNIPVEVRGSDSPELMRQVVSALRENRNIKVVVKIGDRELHDITTEIIRTNPEAQRQVRRAANGG